VDLTIKTDRIPPEGRDLRGQLEAAQLRDCLDAQGHTGLRFPEGAAVDLRIEKIEYAIRIVGRVTTQLIGDCARCLTEARVPVDAQVDMTLFPAGREQEREEEAELEQRLPDLNESGVQSGTYSGLDLELTETLRELILLELPLRLLCTESCAGLCDLCGHNLNQGPCGCIRDEVDPRWEKLKAFKVS